MIAAQNMLHPAAGRQMDYSAIPRAVFTDPEVASVGLTADEASAAGRAVKARCLEFAHVPKAAATHDTQGLIKMVMDTNTRKVLGVQIVGPRASEIVHEAALAIHCGLTTDDLIDTIHVYPTMAESIRLVAQTFSKDVAKLSCCAE